MDRLGQPIHINKIDLRDPFNYQDNEKARLKVPITGKNTSADVLIYAIKIENK